MAGQHGMIGWRACDRFLGDDSNMAATQQLQDWASSDHLLCVASLLCHGHMAPCMPLWPVAVACVAHLCNALVLHECHPLLHCRSSKEASAGSTILYMALARGVHSSEVSLTIACRNQHGESQRASVIHAMHQSGAHAPA